MKSIPSQKSYNELASSWLAATQSGDWMQSECFASLLFEECRVQLNRRGLKGLMAGMESEVRQEACAVLFGSFLLRNRRLQKATDSENLDDIRKHLRWSVKRCLKIAVLRLARKRAREAAFIENDFDLDRLESPPHPWLKTYMDLSCEERCAMALAALQLAIQQRLLSSKNARVTRMILEEGMSPREAAKLMGVSSRAINQQLTRVAAQLSILKEAVEVEFSQP
jgi:hypothetical protein